MHKDGLSEGKCETEYKCQLLKDHVCSAKEFTFILIKLAAFEGE